MSAIITFARQEVLALRRERLPMSMLAVFFLMVSVSSLIGWMTKTTVSDVWGRTKAAGLTAAANPFSEVSALYYARNAIIYIILIGTLMAIVAGVTAALRDRKAQTIDLILSRPNSRLSFVYGKFLGVALWIGSTILGVGIIAALILTLINGSLLAPSEYLSLFLFFGLSIPLLTGFASMGLIGGWLSSRETSALLAPISLWSFITFVAPQIGTAASPVALLNPVPMPATPGGPFDFLNLLVGPFAVSEQFKAASGLIMQDPDITGNLPVALTVVFCFALLLIIAIAGVQRESIRGVLSE